MPVKKKRRKAVAKRPSYNPVSLEGAWGCFTDDVAATVDWKALTDAFDGLMKSRLWSLNLTSDVVAQTLPLRRNGEEGTKVSVLSAVKGMRDGCNGDALEEHPHFIACSGASLEAVEGRGRGWVAKRVLPTGTIVLAEKPLVAVLDKEWGDEKWSGCDSADTAALGIRLAHAFSPSFRAALSAMHPGEGEIPDLPEDEDDDEEETEALHEAVDVAWMDAHGVTPGEAMRLQAVVRLNALGFYTNSEQICHSGNFTALTGTGIFAIGSGFNHSCEPNVSRFSLGAVTVFVTNRPIAVGEELCISYIESELLCAPTSMRCQSLNRDFVCACPKCTASPAASEPAAMQPKRYVRVDARLQAELSLLAPAERAEAVEAALRGEGFEDEGDESGEADEEPGAVVVLGKDAQELRVVQALALMQLKDYSGALKLWRRLAAFTCTHCPPHDEALVAYAVQASLCALAAGDSDAAAADCAAVALAGHRVCCGFGGLFAWRYRLEVEEAYVSDEAKASFWKLAASTKPRGSCGSSEACEGDWPALVRIWNFSPDEVPGLSEQ